MKHERTRTARCTESALYGPILGLFREHAFVFAEVPFFGKHIDLVFATRALLRLYAVEMKLSAWRSAFKQAALNQLAVQQSYVALPERLATKLMDRDRELFVSYDVGLIAVGDFTRILIPASRNGHFNLRHYRTLKTTLAHATRTQVPQRMGVLTNALTERSRTMVLLQARTHKREGAV